MTPGSHQRLAARIVDTSVRITGDLTIRGVTKPVTFDLGYTGSAKDPMGNDRRGFEGSLVVNERTGE